MVQTIPFLVAKALGDDGKVADLKRIWARRPSTPIQRNGRAAKQTNKQTIKQSSARRAGLAPQCSRLVCSRWRAAVLIARAGDARRAVAVRLQRRGHDPLGQGAVAALLRQPSVPQDQGRAQAVRAHSRRALFRGIASPGSKPQSQGCRHRRHRCVFLFGLQPAFIDQIHDTIKTQIPHSSKSTCACYGQIYFKAWRTASGSAPATRRCRLLLQFIRVGKRKATGCNLWSAQCPLRARHAGC